MATDGNSIYYNSDFVNNTLTKYDSQGKADVKEVVFVLCHEVLHCSMFHFIRKQKNAIVWNMAADYAINWILDEMFKSEGSNAFGKAPDKILLDKQYENWPAEAIYEHLMKNAKKIPQNFNNVGNVMEPQEGGGGTNPYDQEDNDESGAQKEGDDDGDGKEGEGKEGEGKEGKPCKSCNGTGKDENGEDCPDCNGTGKEGEEGDKDGKDGEGEGKDGEGEGKDGEGKFKKDDKKDIKDPEKLKDKWDKMNKDARSKHQGSGSLGIDRYVRDLLKPQVNWKNELKKFVKRAMSDKVKFINPERRLVHSNTYIWGRKRDNDAYDNAVVIVDTSGSISDKILQAFATEIKAMYSDVNILEFFVISCDDEITDVKSFKDVKKLQLTKFPGGGGTSFKPPFTWIYKNLVRKNRTPSFCIYFTDGYGDFPIASEVKYGRDVLWVILDDQDDRIKIPFGKKLNIKSSEFSRD
jgi:predicted metal-dependent peptidase